MNGQTRSTAMNTRIIYAGCLLVFGVVACAAWLTAGLTGKIFPEWDRRGVVILCLLAALEALLSYLFVKNSPAIQKQLVNYYISVWTVNLVVVKVFTEIRSGPVHLWENITSWPADFPLHVLNGAFLLNAFIVYAAWQIALLFVADLYRLDIQETAPTEDAQAPSARERVRRRFLFLAMAMTLFAGIQLHGVPGGQASFVPSTILLVLVAFFMLGFGLISLVKFANLHVAWTQAQVDIPAQVARRWALYSLLMLIPLALVSVWLPTTYSLGFLETVLAVLHFVFAAASLLIVAMVTLFGIIFNFFASLFGLNTPTQQPSQPAPLSQIAPQGATAITPVSALLTAIIWGALITLAIAAIRQHLASHRVLAQELKRFKLLVWLAKGWERLKKLLTKAGRQAGELVKNGWERLRGPAKTGSTADPWDYVHLGRLSTRQKILFYYFALIRRASAAGLPRRHNQTPYEYARSLTSSLRDEKEAVDALTDSFVEARYSRHDPAAESATRTQLLWERIRKFLRRTHKTE